MIMRFTLGLWLLVAMAARAQAPAAPASLSTDELVGIDGTETRGRVLLITPELVRYLPDSARTDTATVAREAVFMIRFADGRRQVLHALPEAPPVDMAAKGKADARANYRNRAAFWGTYGATVGFGGMGLLTGAGTAVGIAATPPKLHNLRAPEPELLQDPAYGAAYRQEAKRRKANSALGGYAAGVGTMLTVVAIAVAAYLTP